MTNQADDADDGEQDGYEHRQAFPSAAYLIHRRYQELHGDVPFLMRLDAAGGRLGMDDCLLADRITPGHRELVHDLMAANLTHEQAALILGTTRSSLQKHFGYELEVGAVVAMVGVATAMHKNAIAGNAQSQKTWLAANPKVQWSEKGNELTLSTEATEEQRKATEALNALASAIAVDKDVHRPPKAVPKQKKPPTVKAGSGVVKSTIRRPRKEDK